MGRCEAKAEERDEPAARFSQSPSRRVGRNRRDASVQAKELPRWVLQARQRTGLIEIDLGDRRFLRVNADAFGRVLNVMRRR